MTRIVAIGASQGGVRALVQLVKGLGGGFPAPILVCLHIGAHDSHLPSILGEIDGLSAAFAKHGELLEPGHIYVAPPDRHLLVNGSQVELSRGPRENWARPAIDPLFRSVALNHGPDAIGVILSGRLNDGTAGLYEIKHRGGIAIVQTPAEAEVPDMPRSALENVPVDYSLPVPEIARLLTRLAGEAGQKESPDTQGRHAMQQDQLRKPSAQTCPECGGAMREETIGTLTRFLCHIGHAMTAEILATSQLEALENELSALLRRINERAGLCRDMAAKYRALGDDRGAEAWSQAADQAVSREDATQKLMKAEWMHPETELLKR